MVDHPYNKDFTLTEDTAPVKDGRDHIVRLAYKGVGIALFRLWFEPSEKAAANGKVRIDYKQDRTPQEHIEVYGYLAEWTRLKYELGYVPSWADDMKVDIYANR